MHRKTLQAGVLGAGMSFFLSSTGLSQVTASDDRSSSNLEEIVVTAEFRRENLQDTPISITALTGASLEAKGSTYILDVAKQAPGVLLEPGASYAGPTISATIRGIGQVDPSPATEPGVGIYVDDVYQPSVKGTTFDLLDIDRIEILRGPQGTLAGRNSIGGAIRIYSKAPDGESAVRLSALYGSRDRLELRGSMDFALTDELFVRVSGVSKTQDGYVKQIDYGCSHPGIVIPPLRPVGDCAVADLGGVGERAIRAMVRYVPNSTIDATLIASYRKEQHTVAANILLDGYNATPNGNYAGLPFTTANFRCGRYCTYASFQNPAANFTSFAYPPPGLNLNAFSAPNELKDEGLDVSGQVNFTLAENFSVHAITAYRTFEDRFGDDADASPAFLDLNYVGDRNWSFSQELRADWDITHAVDLTAGLYYFKQMSRDNSDQDSRTSFFPVYWYSRDEVPADSSAAFIHSVWRVTDALSFSGGARYTKERKDYTFIKQNFDGGPPYFVTFLDGLTAHYSDKFFDYRVSGEFRISPAAMLYASVSTGEKGGGISPRPFVPEQAQPFSPEKLRAHEIGAKTDLFDRRVRLNVAAFYNNYDDIQLLLQSCPQFGGPAPCLLTANGGSGIVKGFEGEFTVAPNEAFSLDGSLGFLNFHYTHINPAAGGPGNPAGAQFGDPLPAAPKWKWNAGAQYVFRLTMGGTVTPRVDVTHQDKFFYGHGPQPTPDTPGSQVYIDARTLANVHLTWANMRGNVSVVLEGTNLANKYYIQNGTDVRQSLGFFTGVVGRPREWAVSVRSNF